MVHSDAFCDLCSTTFREGDIRVFHAVTFFCIRFVIYWWPFVFPEITSLRYIALKSQHTVTNISGGSTGGKEGACPHPSWSCFVTIYLII